DVRDGRAARRRADLPKARRAVLADENGLLRARVVRGQTTFGRRPVLARAQRLEIERQRYLLAVAAHSNDGARGPRKVEADVGAGREGEIHLIDARAAHLQPV